MRSISLSACFISSIDSVYSHAPSLVTPMPQHAGMQEILIDSGKLVFQNRVQMPQNGCIATHGRLQEDSAWKHLATQRCSDRKVGVATLNPSPLLWAVGAGTRSSAEAAALHRGRICRIAALCRGTGRASIPCSSRPRHGREIRDL